MARTLFVPEVAPSAAPPDDYQRIQSSPAEFGGLIGQAAERGGAQIHQLGGQVLDVYDQLASTQAFTDYQHAVTDLMYGDPASGKKGLIQMTGQEAMTALPVVQKQMNDLVGNIKGGLKTVGSQVEFERASRRLQTTMMEMAGRHYDQQSKVWGISVSDGSMAATERSTANSYNDDEFFKHSREEMRGDAVKKAQLLGHDPVGAIAEADSRLVQARLNGALAQRDYTTAGQIFQQYGNLLDDKVRPTYQAHIHAGADSALGDDLLRTASGRASAAPASPAATPAGGDHVENWETQHFNFGGIRKAGIVAGPNAGGFESYATPEEGVGAVKRLLTVYQDKHGLDTIRGIVSRWAPPNENPTDTLIARAAQVTGFAPDQKLDLHDPGVMQKMIEATIRNEQGGKLPVDPAVIQKVAGGTDQMVGQPQPATPAPSPAPGMADLANAEAELARRHAQTVDNLTNDPRAAASPTALAHALSKADTEFRSKQMALTAQKQAITEARNATADQYVQRMMKGPIDPSIVQQVADDPHLDTQTRENLWRLYDAHTKQGTEGDLAKYGPKFFDYYQRVTAQDGDPNRLRDPSQLYALAQPKPDGTQDLTLAGVDKLNAELRARQSPERVGDSEIQKGALAYAKHQLSFEADYGVFKIPDPKGLDAFNIGFLPAFFNYYEKGIAAGKSPQELVARDKLDTLLAPFRRPEAELMRDKLAAGSEAGHPPANAAKAPAAAPPSAVDYLKLHPELRGAFEEKYGPGSAAAVPPPGPPEIRPPVAPP